MSTLSEINLQIQKHDEQIAQLRKQAEDLRNQERSGVIEEVRRKIAEYGISAADLKLTGRGAAKRGPAARGVQLRISVGAALPQDWGRDGEARERAGRPPSPYP